MKTMIGKYAARRHYNVFKVWGDGEDKYFVSKDVSRVIKQFPDSNVVLSGIEWNKRYKII